MTRLSVASLARDVDGILSRVKSNKERIVLRKGNKDVAVIVPLDDVARLRSMSAEDRLDATEADRRLSDPNEKRIPYELVRARAGLA